MNFLILTLYPYKLTLSTFDFNNKFSNNKIITIYKKKKKLSLFIFVHYLSICNCIALHINKFVYVRKKRNNEEIKISFSFILSSAIKLSTSWFALKAFLEHVSTSSLTIEFGETFSSRVERTSRLIRRLATLASSSKPGTRSVFTCQQAEQIVAKRA